MNNHEVAVVGLGATGAFVARAAYDLGYRVTIYVHGKANTTPPGAFWLHWLPEDMTGQYQSRSIRIIGKGTQGNYVKLQWGAMSNRMNITSSFPIKEVIEKGYNPEEVLPHLVPDEVKIEYVPFPFSDGDVRDLRHGFEAVFQTFPRKIDIDNQPEKIPFIAAAKFSTEDPAINVVVYNGTGEGIVVREAILFGNHYLEFPKDMPIAEVKKKYDLSGYHWVELKDLAPHTKPVPQPGDGIYLMGRLAQWDRRCLSHDAYSRTVKILEGDIS
jgi:hypothetical protein